MLIRWLLEEVKRSGMDIVDVYREAGAKIPARPNNSFQNMKNKSARTLNIAVPLGLLEWAVSRRFKGDMSKAEQVLAGLSEEDFKQVLTQAERLRAGPVQTSARTPAKEGIPPFSSIKADGDFKVYTPPPSKKPETKPNQGVVSEDAAPYGSDPMKMSGPEVAPIEEQLAPVDLRDELPVFHVSKRAGKFPIKIPKWFVAAGAGREIQSCKDYLYFRELPDWKNYHSAEVVGESMLQTLRPHDMVILKVLNNNEGIALEPLDSDDLKSPMQRLQAYVPNRSICVLRINQDEPTLKRVLYYPGQTSKDWKLVIEADNRSVWAPRPIDLKDHVVFYAVAVGLAKE